MANATWQMPPNCEAVHGADLRPRAKFQPDPFSHLGDTSRTHTDTKYT